MIDGGETRTGGDARTFPETLWSLVVRARDRADPRRKEALNELVSMYWKPAYFYLRHRGLNSEAAKDVTQEFFTTFLEKDYLQSFDGAKGRFKTFLLITLKHFLSKQRDRAAAQKRGGGVSFMQADIDLLETRLQPRLTRGDDPERAFQREWAVTLLQHALRQLQKECETQGRQSYFRIFQSHLSASPDAASYRDLAAQLNVSEGDVRNALHRIRRRLRQLIVEAVREYVDDEKQVETELQELFLSL